MRASGTCAMPFCRITRTVFARVAAVSRRADTARGTSRRALVPGCSTIPGVRESSEPGDDADRNQPTTPRPRRYLRRLHAGRARGRPRRPGVRAHGPDRECPLVLLAALDERAEP